MAGSPLAGRKARVLYRNPDGSTVPQVEDEHDEILVTVGRDGSMLEERIVGLAGLREGWEAAAADSVPVEPAAAAVPSGGVPERFQGRRGVGFVEAPVVEPVEPKGRKRSLLRRSKGADSSRVVPSESDADVRVSESVSAPVPDPIKDIEVAITAALGAGRVPDHDALLHRMGTLGSRPDYAQFYAALGRLMAAGIVSFESGAGLWMTDASKVPV